MRIALINQPQDLTLAGEEQRGSVAIVNWELARHLAKHHDVILYGRWSAGQPRRERCDGIEIRRVRWVAPTLHKGAQLLLGHFAGKPYFNSRVYFREYYLQVIRDLRRRLPDIVHWPEQLQFAGLLRRNLSNAKLVLHMHQDALAHLDYADVCHSLRHLDAVVTVSDYVTVRARERFPEFASRIHTIGNGVDVDRFRPAQQARPAQCRTRLLFVGRVSPEKGVHLLIDAFETAARECADLELKIVGKASLLPYDVLGLLLRDDVALDSLREFYGRSLPEWLTKEVFGHRRSYLAAIRARLSVRTRERVRFVGAVARRELTQIYREADLLVLTPIWQESYGLPIVEAMASGVPVLASRCGGIPELVDPGVTGILVPHCNLDALVAAIRGLRADPQRLKEMAAAARVRAETLLTWKRSARRLERVYQGLIDRGPERDGSHDAARNWSGLVIPLGFTLHTTQLPAVIFAAVATA